VFEFTALAELELGNSNSLVALFRKDKAREREVNQEPKKEFEKVDECSRKRRIQVRDERAMCTDDHKPAIALTAVPLKYKVGIAVGSGIAIAVAISIVVSIASCDAGQIDTALSRTLPTFFTPKTVTLEPFATVCIFLARTTVSIVSTP
jgi:hypothetical protein